MAARRSVVIRLAQLNGGEPAVAGDDGERKVLGLLGDGTGSSARRHGRFASYTTRVGCVSRRIAASAPGTAASRARSGSTPQRAWSGRASPNLRGPARRSRPRARTSPRPRRWCPNRCRASPRWSGRNCRPQLPRGCCHAREHEPGGHARGRRTGARPPRGRRGDGTPIAIARVHALMRDFDVRDFLVVAASIIRSLAPRRSNTTPRGAAAADAPGAHHHRDPRASSDSAARWTTPPPPARACANARFSSVSKRRLEKPNGGHNPARRKLEGVRAGAQAGLAHFCAWPPPRPRPGRGQDVVPEPTSEGQEGERAVGRDRVPARRAPRADVRVLVAPLAVAAAASSLAPPPAASPRPRTSARTPRAAAAPGSA